MRTSSDPQSAQMIAKPGNLFFGCIPSDVVVSCLLPHVGLRELDSLLATSRGTRYITLRYYRQAITDLREMCEVIGPEIFKDKNLQEALLMGENLTLVYFGPNHTNRKQMCSHLVFTVRGYERRFDNTGGLSGLKLSLARRLVRQFVSLRQKLETEGPAGLSDIDLVVDQVFPKLLKLGFYRFDGEGDVPVKSRAEMLAKRSSCDSPDMSSLEGTLQAMSVSCYHWPKYLGRVCFPPASLDRIRHIEELHLDLNLLHPLPKCMGQLKQLRSLELDCRSDFPHWVLQLSNLKKLKFNRGTFGLLPNEMEKLQKLEELAVIDCDLSAIDPCIRSLPSLQTLLLSGNQIKDIPEWLVGSDHLRFLDLDRNPVQLPQNVRYESNPSAISHAQLSIQANNQLYYVQQIASAGLVDNEPAVSGFFSSSCWIF